MVVAQHLPKNKKPNQKKFVIAGMVLPLMLIALVVFLIANRNSDNKMNKTANSGSTSQIDYGPPKASDKANNEANKQRIINEQNQQAAGGGDTGSGDTSKVKTVSPVITFIDHETGNVEVGSFVNGIIEAGGTCTLSATAGGQTVTRTGTSIANSSNTACPAMSIPKSGLPGNSWTIFVSYSSAAATGKSDSQTVEVN